jgi:hypothetical protein
VSALAPVRLLAIALALVGVIALSSPVAASAKQPCWKDILDDWYPDERIDGSYPQACYRAADKNIPQDLRDYSDLPSEIARARLRDIRDSRVDPDGNDRFPAGVGGAGPVDDRNDDDDASGGSGNPSDGAIGSALDALGPDSADSAPIPLLILAGLALLLVAAGGAGLLTRRLQARRAPPGGPPPGPQV